MMMCWTDIFQVTKFSSFTGTSLFKKFSSSWFDHGPQNKHLELVKVTGIEVESGVNEPHGSRNFIFITIPSYRFICTLKDHIIHVLVRRLINKFKSWHNRILIPTDKRHSISLFGTANFNLFIFIWR